MADTVIKRMSSENYMFISFQTERIMIVETVLLLIMNPIRNYTGYIITRKTVTTIIFLSI